MIEPALSASDPTWAAEIARLHRENAELREHIAASDQANAISRNLVITQFKEIERVLSLFSEENGLRKGILDAAHQLSVIYCDCQGIIRLYNLGAEALLGYPSETVLGRMAITDLHDPQELAPFSEHPDTPAAVVEAIFQAILRHRLPAREWRYRRQDGRFIPVNLSFSIVTNTADQRIGLMCAAMDISDLKSAEDRLRQKNSELESTISTLRRTQQQLLQAEKMASVGQLAAGVAHEINNPIGFVTANIGSLGRSVTQLLVVIAAYAPADALLAQAPALAAAVDRAKQEADLEFIREDTPELLAESQQGLLRVKKIVEDLRVFANRAESGWAMADINAALDSALNLLSGELAAYRVERDQQPLPEINCLSAELNQAFMALLRNALQAMPGGGTLRVGSRASETAIEITVADTGCGILPEHLPHLFDPFFTTRPVGSGTGLGLTLAFGIVEKHGGRIEVESKPGAGSLFRLLLPLNDARDIDTGAGLPTRQGAK